MKHRTTFEAPFSASHLYGAGRCKDVLHGHTWRLVLTIDSEPADEEGRRVAFSVLRALIGEIDQRHLNDQLPASIPSPQGVAAWAWERCDMIVPGLWRVMVAMGGEVAIVERS